MNYATGRFIILDEIYTNVSQWHDLPSSAPFAEGADGCIIPLSSDWCRQRFDESDWFTTVWSTNPKDGALWLQTSRTFNSSQSYKRSTCEDMLEYLDCVVSSLVEKFVNAMEHINLEQMIFSVTLLGIASLLAITIWWSTVVTRTKFKKVLGIYVTITLPTSNQ